MTSQTQRKMQLPPLGKRKRKENIASISTTRSTSKPSIPAPTATTRSTSKPKPLIPTLTATRKALNKPKPWNLLLAGYLANEFLTKDTLFGRTLESAKARPGPFIYSSYLAKPKGGAELIQQDKGKLDLAQAEPKNDEKQPQQAQGKPDSFCSKPNNKRKKLPTQGKPDLARGTSSTEQKMRKPVLQDSEAKSRNLDHHYREVANLVKTNQVQIPSIVNPKQLYQWIKRW